VSNQDLAFHYVCTWEDAKKIAGQHDRFWVENCGCRERKEEGCSRSRKDICLVFKGDTQASSGSGRKEISRAELDEIFRETKEKHLVTRPFRNAEDMSQTDGICFCCDDCCGYFLDPTEKCDKGIHIEKTEMDQCTHCGICTEVCYFEARKMDNGKLIIQRDNCYGCGLCTQVCPEDCLQMVQRN
jgi:UDP-glucose 4-epimerase